MTRATQPALPGTMNKSQQQAHRCLELRDELAIAKARFDCSLKVLEQRMLEDNLAEVYARSVRFRREISERIKVDGYEKPTIDVEDLGN